jgi:hypothetical protein
MQINATQAQTTNLTQMRSEESTKPKATVIKPNTRCSGFFNNRKMLLIAGVVATTGIALFILMNNYATQAAEAAKQAAKLAKRAANLQKPCIVATEKQLFAATREQIAKCGLQMMTNDVMTNDDDIRIFCDPKVVQETAEKYELKYNLNCDETVKNTFSGKVLVKHRPSGDEIGVIGEDLVWAEKLSPYLERMLSYRDTDLTLTLNQARVKEWEVWFNKLNDNFKAFSKKALENEATNQVGASVL